MPHRCNKLGGAERLRHEDGPVVQVHVTGEHVRTAGDEHHRNLRTAFVEVICDLDAISGARHMDVGHQQADLVTVAVNQDSCLIAMLGFVHLEPGFSSTRMSRMSDSSSTRRMHKVRLPVKARRHSTALIAVGCLRHELTTVLEAYDV